MNKKWIIVADRSKARFFEYQGPGKPFVLIEKLDHPEGRLKKRDFYDDAQGRTFDSFGAGRHKLEVIEESKEQENKRFAGEICELLKNAKLENKFENLYIASGPAFLGYIKEKMDPGVLKTVQAWIPKNLGNIEDKEIHEYFKEHINI